MAANERISVNLKMLINLAKSAAMLKLSRSGIKSQQSGGYLSKIKGRGMEFDEVRPYQAGDDIRSIDWRVTARTGKTHTKLFREERERPVFISVDYRASMQFATRGVFKAVQAAKIASLIAWMAQRQGDRIGGQIFTDQSCRELKPGNGKQSVLHFLNALVKSESSFAVSSLEQVLGRLSQHVRPGSLVYIISDFRGINEAAEMLLAKMARHCELVLVQIYDPLESALPKKGRFRFTDKQQDVIVDAGDKTRMANYQEKFQQHSAVLEKLALQSNICLLSCSTQEQASAVFSRS
ncbi:MAG: DUF58 domain-containing protein [Methyloprofundus sp.]|nr:DUF58 domain-containing protein [Methyloprofundus sp.]